MHAWFRTRPSGMMRATDDPFPLPMPPVCGGYARPSHVVWDQAKKHLVDSFYPFSPRSALYTACQYFSSCTGGIEQ